MKLKLFLSFKWLFEFKAELEAVELEQYALSLLDAEIEKLKQL